MVRYISTVITIPSPFFCFVGLSGAKPNAFNAFVGLWLTPRSANVPLLRNANANNPTYETRLFAIWLRHCYKYPFFTVSTKSEYIKCIV